MQSSRGFVILFAVLISAIILLIGGGIFSISFKETVLSSTARESQYAINAADAGVECALYHDVILDGFTLGNPVDCANQQAIVNGGTFNLGFQNNNENSCVRVHIEKNPSTDPNFAGYNEVSIVAQGYNVCDQDQPMTQNPLLIERVYRVIYLQLPSQTP